LTKQKYKHINHKLNILNIKYYNFDSNFDTTSFTAKITRKCEIDTLDDIRTTPCPKMSSSKAVNTYGVSQYVVQPSSLDLSLVPVLDIIERERRTIYTVRSTRKDNTLP
jgi:hypothetical protein